MDRKKAEQEAFRIIDEFGEVLNNSVKRTFVIPESRLPYTKKVIKNAIRVALLAVDNNDKKENLKSRYISLGNIVSDSDAKKAEKTSIGLFPFLNMDEKDKKVFLRERFESGLLGDYELAMQISKKIADEQRRLKKEIEEYLLRIKKREND
jgi:hypothetical protein